MTLRKRSINNESSLHSIEFFFSPFSHDCCYSNRRMQLHDVVFFYSSASSKHKCICKRKNRDKEEEEKVEERIIHHIFVVGLFFVRNKHHR